jgi:hypothetical protein
MRNALQFSVLYIITLTSPLAQAAETDYFVTQIGSGSRTGLTSENAWSVADFNNSSHWASADTPSKIDPGDTVYLNGEITSSITVRGSGTADHPITIDGSNASIRVDIVSAGKIIYIENQRHLVLQNLTIDGLDHNLATAGNGAAIYIREFGFPTEDITIQDSHLKASCSGIMLQGSVKKVNVHRNNVELMANDGVSVRVDNYDGDEKNGYDDAPGYVTVGGSAANGNTFKNVGYLTAGDGNNSGSHPGSVFGTAVTDSVFSYNHVYADMKDVGAGIYLNGAKRILVEYNAIHGLEAVKHRSYINFKTDRGLYSEDIVIRFNNVYDIYAGPNQYTKPGECITISGEGQHFVLHGNYCEGAGINMNWNWQENNNGIGGNGYYVWANVINGTKAGGGISINGISTNTDSFSNFYILNNTIYRAVTDHANGAYFYGISDSKGRAADIINGIYVMNNIVADTRPNSSEHIGISLTSQSDLTLADNLESTSANAALYTNNALLSLQNQSPAIDAGADLSAYDAKLPTLQIQGVSYSFSFSELLDPAKTNWLAPSSRDATNPQVATGNQRNHERWEKGAYIWFPTLKPEPLTPSQEL